MSKSSPNPKAVLFYGDPVLCKKDLVKIRNKYGDSQWVEISFAKSPMNEVRAEVGFVGFGCNHKIVVINDFSINKADKEFLIDVCNNHPDNIIVVLFDSSESVNQKQTGKKFVEEFKKIGNVKVINNGEEFTEKEEQDTCKYIQQVFAKYGKKISYTASQIMAGIVGRKRSFLVSEIEKLVLTCPDEIDESFIEENCFHVSQDAVLYKLGNVIDNFDFNGSILMVKHFIENGVHSHVIAEILCKKAKWRLIAIDLWSKGYSWGEIEKELVQAGSFPSFIWRDDNLTLSQKKEYESIKDPVEIMKLLKKEVGVPLDYMNRLKEKGAKLKSPDKLPMPFLASMLVQSIRRSLVYPSKLEEKELKEKLLSHSINVYLKCTDGMKNIREHGNDEQELFTMVRHLSIRPC